ncbi:MAG: hypothetical protein HZB31_09900 [Nitrospirae bacterium]|nr:hypothetical protein [Nitrospirota bacterium]
MLTLGIHDGHTATACLLEDGEIVACISEERLNREKEWTGFPAAAIRKCLETAGKGYNDIDAVGVCSLMPQIGSEHYFNPQGYKKLFSYAAKVCPGNLLQGSGNIKLIHSLSGSIIRRRKELMLAHIAELGIRTQNIFFFEHHLSHAATAYYMNWYKKDKNLVITLDGSGDAVCGTVNIGTNGELTRIAEVFNYNSICEFYTRITQFLGMKPMSHEYKVMGMAPYASESRRKEILEIFRRYFRITEKNPLVFHNTSGLWKWQFMKEFRDTLAEKRFDWVAGGVQDFFEEIVLQWIRNAIKATGCGDLALSGGGFMNVKVNYLISKLPEVKSLFVFPSCGDESNPVGAAILAALKAGFPEDTIKPLGMIYWGMSYSDNDIRAAIDTHLASSGMKISEHKNINSVVAQKVADKKIVGRFTGKMEWGARALGNRSIIADPQNPNIIHRINKAIKMRDFWMPFAPAILQEYREIYLELRADYKCPFMTIASDTKEAAWDAIAAGLHPFDKSARAQILDPVNHPSFHELVSEFEKLTGVGGVLNTSFNLHGEPIVCTPSDAISTFLRSDLDVLQLENILVEK